MLESVQSRFEISVHLSVNVFPPTSRELLKTVRGKKYREMYAEIKKHNWTLSTTAIYSAPLNFVRKTHN